MGKPLLVVGSINLDLVVHAARIPRPGETVSGTSYAEFHGGKGANQAVGIARLGHSVIMLGCVGDDAYGQRLKTALTAAGVGTGFLETVPGPSGIAFISHCTSGENSIIVVPGANAHVTAPYLERHKSLIGGAAMILAQLEIPLATVEVLADMACEAQVPFILDPAPALPLSARLLRNVTWLTPNETEASALLEQETDDIPVSEVAERLLATGVRNLVLKLGSRGVFIAGKDTPCALIPALKVSVVDTTAAGDTFNAAFAVKLVDGVSPCQAAQYANVAGAISVTRQGAQPSMPSVEEISSLIRTFDGMSKIGVTTASPDIVHRSDAR